MNERNLLDELDAIDRRFDARCRRNRRVDIVLILLLSTWLLVLVAR